MLARRFRTRCCDAFKATPLILGAGHLADEDVKETSAKADIFVSSELLRLIRIFHVSSTRRSSVGD
jgi:hypothetical protein